MRSGARRCPAACRTETALCCSTSRCRRRGRCARLRRRTACCCRQAGAAGAACVPGASRPPLVDAILVRREGEGAGRRHDGVAARWRLVLQVPPHSPRAQQTPGLGQVEPQRASCASFVRSKPAAGCREQRGDGQPGDGQPDPRAEGKPVPLQHPSKGFELLTAWCMPQTPRQRAPALSTSLKLLPP